MKTQSKAIFASLAVLILALCTVSGATYSWFTDQTNTEITISTGKVDIEAGIVEGNQLNEKVSLNGIYALWTGESMTYKIENNSNVPATVGVKVRTWMEYSVESATQGVTITKELEENIADNMVITFNGEEHSFSDVEDGEIELAGWESWAMNGNGGYDDKEYNVVFRAESGLDASGVVITVVIKSEAIQGDAPVIDSWDGTADSSWYNDTDTEFTLDSSEQLAGLAELVDAGNNFAGKTIKLDSDMDLYYVPEGATEPKSFDPIGDKSAFAGTFDGQGHSINNLYQSGWAFGYEWGSYGSVGLFGELESAIVKNVTIEGAESLVEGGDIGGITGSATGTCVFENITLKDSVFATYNNGNGGIIGWSGAGNYTFKNITISEDVVLAGLWGSFDSSIGGVVGQGEPGATYNFEDVEINCRLDVYNDCTASYDYYNYRMCGMIIGRLQETTTIDGTNYPDTSKYNIICNNVTVTYGDWANYHYCEPTPGLNGGRGMRVESGYSYDGLPADYDHSQCVDNHMNLIPFDQIFGGAQLGVKGLKTYDGVNVVYNNK